MVGLFHGLLSLATHFPQRLTSERLGWAGLGGRGVRRGTLARTAVRCGAEASERRSERFPGSPPDSTQATRTHGAGTWPSSRFQPAPSSDT